MNDSYNTYLVDVLSDLGGIPSSGGVRGNDGRILAQYINPRPYKPQSFSNGTLLALGAFTGIGLLVWGAYKIYKLCSEEPAPSTTYTQEINYREILEYLERIDNNTQRLLEQTRDQNSAVSTHSPMVIHAKANISPICSERLRLYTLAE